MKRWGRTWGTSNAYFSVKEVNLKRLHMVWFQLTSWKRQNYRDNKMFRGYSGLGMEEG